jgi:pilus assembly protein CpaB
MKNKTTIAGAVLGVIGAGLLALFVAQAGGAKAEETIIAFVVQEDLAPGMGLDDVRSRVGETDVPVSLAPSARITDFEELQGKEVVRAVSTGEILTASQFASAGPAAGGLVVPAGYEAMSVEADPAPGGQGYVTPGSRVNVYTTVTEDGGAPYTQMVLGHVDVLAVTRGNLSGESRPPAENASDGRIVLLLQVRPEDTPVLIHAQRHGALWFTLANEDDPAPAARRVELGELDPGARTQAIHEARARQDAARTASETGPVGE